MTVKKVIENSSRQKKKTISFLDLRFSTKLIKATLVEHDILIQKSPLYYDSTAC